MSTATVFFSWQSDRHPKECRNLIENALKAALERISKGMEIDERPQGLALDKDTKDVPGSPPIFDTILGKIDKAAIFVPDLTFVAQRENGDPMPNSNVLIEYGYALKSLGHGRIIAVMNTAYGKPKRETMPFDLSHHRFPIQYDVPAGASDDERLAQRQQLSQTLESAIRGVLASDAYLSSLAPVAVPKYREPLDGRARFRAKDQPLGFSNDPVQQLVGGKDISVRLADGPAMWLRVMPQKPVKQPLKISDIRNLASELMTTPFYRAYTNSFFVRGNDGGGFAPLGAGITPTVIYMFTDAEIWAVDTYPLEAVPKLIPFDEKEFANSLQSCAKILSERFAIPGPFRWVAGFEGIHGRSLPLPNDRFGRSRGPCAADLVQREGTFTVGENPHEAMEPFFEEMFEQCGLRRAPKASKTSTS